MNVPFLRTQYDLNRDIRVRIRDVDSTRYDDAHIYRMVNDAVQEWGDRVLAPYIYTITGGMVRNDYDYSIPSYVREPLIVQWQRTLDGLMVLGDELVTQWVSFSGWTFEPDGAGGQVLRLGLVPFTTNARILFNAPTGSLPSTPPILGNSPDATDTEITVSGQPEIADVGYVKIDDEWMQYAGMIRSGDTVLTNLVRGVNATTATTHTAGAVCYWGIALPEQMLLQPLMDGAMARLHEMYMAVTSGVDQTQHFDGARYHRQLAAEGLERRTRQPGRMTLHWNPTA